MVIGKLLQPFARFPLGRNFDSGRLNPEEALAAYRFSGTVHLSNDDIGFRVVREDVSAAQP